MVAGPEEQGRQVEEAGTRLGRDAAPRVVGFSGRQSRRQGAQRPVRNAGAAAAVLYRREEA